MRNKKLEELQDRANELFSEIEILESDIENAEWDGLSPCDIRNLKAEKEEKEIEHREVEEEIGNIIFNGG